MVLMVILYPLKQVLNDFNSLNCYGMMPTAEMGLWQTRTCSQQEIDAVTVDVPNADIPNMRVLNS